MLGKQDYSLDKGPEAGFYKDSQSWAESGIRGRQPTGLGMEWPWGGLENRQSISSSHRHAGSEH